MLKEINRATWTIGYTGQSPERLKLHMKNMHTFDVKTLRAKGGPCDGDYFGLPWPCYGTPEIKHPGSPNLYDDVEVDDGRRRLLPRELRRRARRRQPARRGRLVSRRARELTTGYPEFDHVLMKKLGWWDELTDAEKKAAEGKNWKTDLSGGIQRVTMKHGAHFWGNAKARAVVWNFPDGIPQHREPLYSPRPDLVAKYPTHDDKKAFWRLPTLFKSVQQENVKDKVAKKFPLVLTSGRLVEYEGGGEETRSQSVARRAAAGELRRDQPEGRERPRRPRRRVRVGEDADRRADQGQGAWSPSASARARRSSRSTSPAGGGQGHARVLPGGRGADRARRGGQHRDDLRLRLGDDDAGNQDDALPGREVHRRKARRPTMARMKFLCDAERCIECNGCVTACKQEHEIPWGVNRRRVVTINDGVPGERSISVACMHCSDAPCMAVCPVDCFYKTEEGVVLHDKDLCIGCGYCFYACPFGAPQFPQAGAFGVRGKMDKCTFCAGGPEPDQLGGRVPEVRPQPPRRRQAAGVRRNVLDQGAARRRRRRDRRHLSRARHASAARAARCGAGRRRTGRRRRQPGARRRRSGAAPAAPRRAAGGTKS